MVGENFFKKITYISKKFSVLNPTLSNPKLKPLYIYFQA